MTLTGECLRINAQLDTTRVHEKEQVAHALVQFVHHLLSLRLRNDSPMVVAYYISFGERHVHNNTYTEQKRMIQVLLLQTFDTLCL